VAPIVIANRWPRVSVRSFSAASTCSMSVPRACSRAAALAAPILAEVYRTVGFLKP